MEKPKDTSKQEKQKMVIGIGGGGGGVGGVLVWGAAVAIATLVSVSVLKLRNKRLPNKANHHPPPPPQPQPMLSTTDASNNLEVNTNIGDDDQGKGLLVLLQDNSSPPPDYHPSGDGIKDVSLDSTPLDSNKSLILDIDAMLDITRHKEKHHYLDILLGDNPKRKNSSLETCDYGDKQQEYSLAAEEKVLQSDQFEEHSQIPFGKGGEEEEQENGGEIVKEVTETFQIDPFSIELNLEGLEVRAPDAPRIEAEDNIKKMQLLGEQAEEEEEQDDIVETVKEVTETNQKDQFAVELNMEEIQVMKQDEVIGAAPDSPQSEAEDHPQMHLVEEEQENGENILEMVVEVVKTAQKDQFAVELHPESIQVMEEEEAIDSPRIEAEDNPETQLIGEGKEHDHGEREEEDSDEVDEDEEETAEKGEESSEGTGDSSMESNAEAIWPAESIEELSLQLKEESITNIQKLEENNIECRAVGTDDSGCYASIKNQGIYANGNYKNEDTGKSRISSMKDLLMRINVSTDTSNMGIWILSAAVLLLIVMAPLLLSFANIVKLCVIVFLLVILSHNWELP